MGHSDLDPAMYGQRSLKPQDLWAIRFYWDKHNRLMLGFRAKQLM